MGQMNQVDQMDQLNQMIRMIQMDQMNQTLQTEQLIQVNHVNHYVGMDLHSDNVCALMIDDAERWKFKRRLKNDLTVILSTLEPYRKTIRGIAVEATYNWYWLVDGLMKAGYKVYLAHPGALGGNSRKKHTNDFDDAFQLVSLLRQGKLPEAYIYPKEERPVRDLLRKRAFLVRNRTQHITSFINFVNRQKGINLGGNQVKRLSDEDLEDMFNHEYLLLSGKANISTIRHLTTQIGILEKAVLKVGRLKPEFRKLLTIPGIGQAIGLTIAFEVGSLSRFEDVGNYLSYCRCVDSKRITNDKKKGENNRKNGNRYLCWAYVEAANCAKRFCPYARAYYSHKFKESGLTVVAAKALASKIARASYHVMTRDIDYDPEKVFEKFKAEARALIAQKKGRGSKPLKGLVAQTSV